MLEGTLPLVFVRELLNSIPFPMLKGEKET